MTAPLILRPGYPGVVWGDLYPAGNDTNTNRLVVGPNTASAEPSAVVAVVSMSEASSGLTVVGGLSLAGPFQAVVDQPFLIWVSVPPGSAGVQILIDNTDRVTVWHCAHGPLQQIPGPVAPGFSPPGIGAGEVEYAASRTLAGMPTARSSFERGDLYTLRVGPLQRPWVESEWASVADDLAAGPIYWSVGDDFRAFAWQEGRSVARPELDSPLTYRVSLALRGGPPDRTPDLT